MNSPSNTMINDIYQCVELARVLSANLEQKQAGDQELLRVFSSMAGDESVGTLAYVIWRSQARLLSRLRHRYAIRYDGPARVRHAQS